MSTMNLPNVKDLQRRALRLVKDPETLRKVVAEADAKAEAHRSRLGAFWTDLKTLLRLVQAWIGGHYRHVPWKTLLAAIGALLYFLNPLDLIADFLYIFGFLDDALVVGLVLTSIRSDLEKFTAWERSGEIPVSAD
jgi:uncharacterized membrane protein YkvA (DUF1232 family)